jgi:hypothetical protein
MTTLQPSAFEQFKEVEVVAAAAQDRVVAAIEKQTEMIEDEDQREFLAAQGTAQAKTLLFAAKAAAIFIPVAVFVLIGILIAVLLIRIANLIRSVIDFLVPDFIENIGETWQDSTDGEGDLWNVDDDDWRTTKWTKGVVNTVAKWLGQGD